MSARDYTKRRVFLSARAGRYFNPMTKKPHAQYFTRPAVADLMTSLLTVNKDSLIVEPSCGTGVVLDSLARAGFSHTVGIEIDPTLEQSPNATVLHGSFFSWEPIEPISAIIGNPPYIRWKHLDSVARTEVAQLPQWGNGLNSLCDYSTAFIFHAVEMLRNGGELVFITPSSWLTTSHAQPLRDFLLKNGAISDLVDFGESRVFSGVSGAFIVFKFIKGATARDVRCWRYMGTRKLPVTLDLSNPAQFLPVPVRSFLPGARWSLASACAHQLADVVEDMATALGAHTYTTLGNIADISNGMISGNDKLFRFSGTTNTLTGAELRALVPIVKAKQLHGFYAEECSRYIMVPRGIDDNEMAEKYPNFFAYFSSQAAQLSGRYNMTDTPLHPWDWSFPRSLNFFTSDRDKIFVPSKQRLSHGAHPRFSFVPAGIMATQDVSAIALRPEVHESLLYVLGWLSTTSVEQWIRTRGTMKGEVAEFSRAPLASIPVRLINWSDLEDVRLYLQVCAIVRTAVEKNQTAGLREKLDALFFKKTFNSIRKKEEKSFA